MKLIIIIIVALTLSACGSEKGTVTRELCNGEWQFAVEICEESEYSEYHR